MFEEAKRRIMNLESNYYSLSSRVSNCERDINESRSSGPTWDEIYSIKSEIGEFRSQIEEVIANLQVLQGQIQEELSQLRPQTNVSPVEPKQKSDLEILEQNGREQDFISLNDINRMWEFNNGNWYE